MIEGDYNDEDGKKNYRQPTTTTTITYIYVKFVLDSRIKNKINNNETARIRTNTPEKNMGVGWFWAHTQCTGNVRHKTREKNKKKAYETNRENYEDRY